MSLERDPYESIASEAVARWLAAKVAEQRRITRTGRTPEWQTAINQEWEVEARRYAMDIRMFGAKHAVAGLMVELRADPMFRRQP